MAPLIALLTLHPQQLLAADNVAFGVIFGVFVVALLTLMVLVIRWAVRRDRQGRAAWQARRAGGVASTDGEVPPAPGR